MPSVQSVPSSANERALPSNTSKPLPPWLSGVIRGVPKEKSSGQNFTSRTSGRNSHERRGAWSPLVLPSTPQWMPPKQALIITTKG